mgnify:CR=1 FL=1
MTDKHIDRETLSVLREVMEEGYPELLDTFLADSESRLGELQKTSDAKVLSEVAHSFKGSASNKDPAGKAYGSNDMTQHSKNDDLPVVWPPDDRHMKIPSPTTAPARGACRAWAWAAATSPPSTCSPA